MYLEPRNDQFSIFCNETSQENAVNGIKRLSIIGIQVHDELHENFAFLHVNFTEKVNSKVVDKLVCCWYALELHL